MQHYSCVICKADAFGGGSMVHGGMFFKLCPACYENYEDEEALRLLTEYLMQITDDEENDESAKSPVEQQE